MILFGQASSFNMELITYYAGIIIYFALAAVALWGAYCVVLLWRRIAQLQFRSEKEQDAFLEDIENMVKSEKLEDVKFLCENDPRAIAQLSTLAVKHHKLPSVRMKDMLIERYQRDVAEELDYRNTWVQTIIKSAPMLGLFGTVVGMMGAFSKLSAASQVSAEKLATDIMFALITTAIGMAIAIPLILASAGIVIRIGKLEDLVSSGIMRLVEIMEKSRKKSGG